jgi:hypothetical protein
MYQCTGMLGRGAESGSERKSKASPSAELCAVTRNPTSLAFLSDSLDMIAIPMNRFSALPVNDGGAGSLGWSVEIRLIYRVVSRINTAR